MSRQRSDRPGELAGYWLSRRANSPAWCRTWFDAERRQTRRESLGTDDPKCAKLLLAQWVTLRGTMHREDPGAVAIGTVFARYYEQHGQHVRGAGVQKWNLSLMLRNLPVDLSVSGLTLEMQQSVARKMRVGAGLAPGTVKQVFGAAKAAVTWAWKNGELDRPVPFITVQDGPPRERVLSVAELARLLDAAD